MQRWADGTEQQLLFKTHGRTLTYTAAKGALESKALKKDVTRNLMADMLVATYSSGQEEVGELLLKVYGASHAFAACINATRCLKRPSSTDAVRLTQGRPRFEKQSPNGCGQRE